MDAIDLPILGTFLWLAGLCVGSFLNVVIYRLPNDLSVGSPLWSFCPTCRSRIAFRDNLPLVSWLLLRGKCRHCSAPISVQYPLVEALTGLLFVLVFYLIFAADSRADLTRPRMPTDIPLLLSWLTLVAVMVVCSSTDIVSYMIDVRVTNLCVALGICFHAIWPREAWLAQSALPNGYELIWLTIGISAVIWMWITRPRIESPFEEETPDPITDKNDSASPTSSSFSWVALIGMLIFSAGAVWMLIASGYWFKHGSTEEWLPVAVALLLIFAGTVLAGSYERPADDQIEYELIQEETGARKQAVQEIAQLSIIIGLGISSALAILWLIPNGQSWTQAIIEFTPIKDWAPLLGISFAIKGALLAAAAGWALRIGFTLALGREAFGTGDIYILAAAGATAGWDIAILGLLCSVALALAGWTLGLLLKQTAIIPFGPWLAIGFILALWIDKPAANVFATYRDNLVMTWNQQPFMLIVMGGVLLVGSAVAITLSRLVRNLVEPNDPDIEEHGDSPAS